MLGIGVLGFQYIMLQLLEWWIQFRLSVLMHQILPILVDPLLSVVATKRSVVAIGFKIGVICCLSTCMLENTCASII